MNMSNHGSNAETIDAPIPLTILITGDRPSVQATIDQLCALRFCDRAKWSPILKQTDSKAYFSIFMRLI